MSDFEASIRDLISRYLAREVDVDELNDHLPDGWELDEAGDPSATDLALFAIGYLAGYQSGDRDEEQLRSALAQLLSDTVLVEYPAEDLLTVLASRAAQTIAVSVEGDSSLEAGFEREASQHPRTEHRTTTTLLDPPRSR